MPYFSSEKIIALKDELVQAQFVTEDDYESLTVGLPPALIAELPSGGNVSERLLKLLYYLNDCRFIIEGEEHSPFYHVLANVLALRRGRDGVSDALYPYVSAIQQQAEDKIAGAARGIDSSFSMQDALKYLYLFDRNDEEAGFRRIVSKRRVPEPCVPPIVLVLLSVPEDEPTEFGVFRVRKILCDFFKFQMQSEPIFDITGRTIGELASEVAVPYLGEEAYRCNPEELKLKLKSHIEGRCYRFEPRLDLENKTESNEFFEVLALLLTWWGGLGKYKSPPFLFLSINAADSLAMRSVSASIAEVVAQEPGGPVVVGPFSLKECRENDIEIWMNEFQRREKRLMNLHPKVIPTLKAKQAFRLRLVRETIEQFG